MGKMLSAAPKAVVLCLSLLSLVHAADLRVFVQTWMTDFGSNVSYDLDAVRLEASGFLLAAKHFNERRVDMLPDLALLSGCTKNITIVAICDESANSRRAASNLKEFAGEFDAVVGFSSAATEAATTFADVQDDAPVISHWASQVDLSDKLKYPKFSRTFISDQHYYNKIGIFIKSVGFTQTSIIYVDDDVLPASAKNFQTLLIEMGIDSLTFPYQYDNQVSIYNALRRIKESSRSLIIYMGWETDLVSYVADAAANLGLNSTEHLWIFTTADSLPVQEDIENSEELRNLMAGSLYFPFGPSNQTLLSNMFQNFRNEVADDPSVINSFNSKLPPFGNMDETSGSCKNDALDLSISADLFNHDYFDLPVGYPTAYDAVMTLGFAICSDPSLNIPTGQFLNDLIRSVNFQGVSGDIQFDIRGDRLENTTSFYMYNFRTSVDHPDTLELVLTGTFDGSEWAFPDTSTIQLRAGLGWESLPSNYTKPLKNLNYLPTGLMVLGYFEVAIGLLFAACCITWMIRNRSEPVVRAGQPMFILISMLGSICVIFAILPMTADDQPGNPLQASKASCMAIPYLFFVGSQVSMGAIIGKSLRAYHVFKRTSRYHHRTRESHVFLLIGVLVGIDLVLLITWESLAPFEWKRVPLVFDRFGQVMESRGECNFAFDSISAGFVGALAVFYAFTILCLRYVVSLAPKRFVEERNIANGLLQLFALGVPAILAAYSFIIGRFVILTSFFLVCPLLVLAFQVLPMYLLIAEQKRWMRVNTRSTKDAISSQGATGRIDDVDILEALRIPMVQAKFERYAEENYVTESYLFILDVLAYKEQFEKQSNAWRSEKAGSIMKVYIYEGALLQINISEHCHKTVVATYKKYLGARIQLAPELFDPALREVVMMLNHGAWASFVHDGGVYNISSSLLPKSKVLSLFASPASIAEIGVRATTGGTNKTNSSQELGYSVSPKSALISPSSS